MKRKRVTAHDGLGVQNQVVVLVARGIKVREPGVPLVLLQLEINRHLVEKGTDLLLMDAYI